MAQMADAKTGIMAGNRTGHVNGHRAVDAARLLDLPFMCVHTPADNMVNTFLQNLLKKKKPATLGEVVKVLREIPEYTLAAQMGTGPKIVVGSEKKRAGTVMPAREIE